ncbi:hypothetical protein [Chitinophaga caeni]|nr:hypothetical protein [Chitinophaga caeni]
MKHISMSSFDNPGLLPLTIAEMKNTSGGKFPSILKRLTFAALVTWTIENWTDIKKGVNDGWDADHWE